jgi:hypothetical protein
MIILKPLLNLSAFVDGVIDLGAGPAGHRRIVRILGGSFEGERLRGTIREVGADWQTVRADGTVELDVRCLLETSTGDLIHLRGAGLRHGPPEVIARMSKGEDVDPSSYYFREVMRFETSSPKFDWMTRILALATGARTKEQVKLEVFEAL